MERTEAYDGDGPGSGREPVGAALVRVSDAERESIVSRLNEATSEGRLTLEEFSDRVSQALASRTRGDLDVLVRDLPAASGAVARSGSAVAGRAPVVQLTPVGAVKRRGRWRLDRDQSLRTYLGAVKLDLRDAELAAAEVSLRVEATVGSVKVWVPYGVSVEVEGRSVLGSRSVEDDAPRPGAPVLRLRIDTVVGSVKVYRV